MSVSKRSRHNKEYNPENYEQYWNKIYILYRNPILKHMITITGLHIHLILYLIIPQMLLLR